MNHDRAINVTAALDETATSAGAVYAALAADVMPAVERGHAGVRYSFEGSQADQDAVLGSLQVGFPLALFVIFALLAIPLRSYVQPLIIMSAIPFGFVGAVGGHIVMNENVTMVSMLGIVALSGVVVNDSLVMVDFINRERPAGAATLLAAVQEAGAARFRPILLTSITTFAGLMPLLLEQEHAGRFPEADGHLAGLRGVVRHLRHAGAGAGGLPHPGRCRPASAAPVPPAGFTPDREGRGRAAFGRALTRTR